MGESLVKLRLIYSLVSWIQADIFVDYLKSWAMKSLKYDYDKKKDITAIWNTTMKEVSEVTKSNFQQYCKK